MIKIAICDDEEIFLGELTARCREFFSNRKIEYRIKCYRSGTEFITALDEPYDLYLLDVALPDADGLTLASLVRKRNKETCIIFISSVHEAVFPSLCYRPFRFIRKEKIKEELQEALDSFTHKIGSQVYIDVVSDGGQYRIPISSIDYVETDKHYLILHCGEKRYRIRCKLSDFVKKYASYNFSQLNQSFTVNLAYVKSVSTECVVLYNDVKLNPSRPFKNQIKEDFFRYQRRVLHEDLF